MLSIFLDVFNFNHAHKNVFISFGRILRGHTWYGCRPRAALSFWIGKWSEYSLSFISLDLFYISNLKPLNPGEVPSYLSLLIPLYAFGLVARGFQTQLNMPAVFWLTGQGLLIQATERFSSLMSLMFYFSLSHPHTHARVITKLKALMADHSDQS